MGVKISELSELTSINNNDRLIINHENQTYQGSLNTIIGDYLSSYLSDYLSNVVTDSNIGEYLYGTGSIGGSGYLNSYVTSDDLSNYVTSNDLNGYITSNDLFSGYLSEIYNDDGTVDFEAIYNGISSYFET